MNYALHEERMLEARRLLKGLEGRLKDMTAVNNYNLVEALECIDRVDVARVLVEHLIYRKETRWACYQTRLDYPKKMLAGGLRLLIPSIIQKQMK